MLAILIIHLEYDCFKNSKLRTNPLNYTMINKKEKKPSLTVKVSQIMEGDKSRIALGGPLQKYWLFLHVRPPPSTRQLGGPLHL